MNNNKCYFTIILALLFCLWFLQEVSTRVLAADKAGNVQAGMAVHKKQCLRCHGEQGKGDGPGSTLLKVKPADWTDAARMSGISNDELTRVIKEGGVAVGKSKFMPAFGAKLKSQEVSDVIAFIASLPKGKR